jgi:catechol 2,3-dioxygenase-like lactoylglutathione lyase family enzyme
MPSSLSHLFIHVRDLDEARRFWMDLLGLERLVDESGYLRIGGGGGFRAGVEALDPPERLEVVVRVDDVDAMVERLRAAGIEVSDPVDQQWGARHAWLRDPEGRPVSIYSPIAEGGG